MFAVDEWSPLSGCTGTTSKYAIMRPLNMEGAYNMAIDFYNKLSMYLASHVY